jgi:hypothetical protein
MGNSTDWPSTAWTTSPTSSSYARVSGRARHVPDDDNALSAWLRCSWRAARPRRRYAAARRCSCHRRRISPTDLTASTSLRQGPGSVDGCGSSGPPLGTVPVHGVALTPADSPGDLLERMAQTETMAQLPSVIITFLSSDIAESLRRAGATPAKAADNTHALAGNLTTLLSTWHS